MDRQQLCLGLGDDLAQSSVQVSFEIEEPVLFSAQSSKFAVR